jgi:aminopeptidase N
MKSELKLLSFIIFSILFSVQICATEISTALNYIPQDFDVLSYQAALDLSKAADTEMNGVCLITGRWLTNAADNKFYFHLYKLDIDSVIYESSKIDVQKEFITAPDDYYYTVNRIGNNDTFRIMVYYHGRMVPEKGSFQWGGVSSIDDYLFAMGVGFMNSYVSATRHWLPCYDHPSDKAKFSVSIKVPEGYYAASNGLLLKSFPDGNSRVFEWEHTNECATYLLTFAVSKYTAVSIADEPYPMIIYSPAKYAERCKNNFKLLPRMIETFSNNFIDFPFESMSYAITPIGSMEHQTLVSYDESLLSKADTFNEVAAHELAHQWFGDLVTCRDFRDAWLNEGFATYCESIWYDELYGSKYYLSKIRSDVLNYFSRAKSEGVMPLYDFVRTSPSSNYPATIYFKGSSVLSMLRYELGDSIFFTAVREYLKNYQYSDATSEDLKEVFEDVSESDLDWFFDQWVYKPGWPQLSIKAKKINKGDGKFAANVEISQIQPASYGIYTQFPLTLRFWSGNKSMDTIIMIKTEVMDIAIDSVLDFSTIESYPQGSFRALAEVKSSTVGVENEPLAVQALEINPNPAGSVAYIKYSFSSPTPEIKILDLLGRKVKSVLYEGIDSGEFSIPLDDLTPGCYFVIISDGKMNLAKQLIKR